MRSIPASDTRTVKGGKNKGEGGSEVDSNAGNPMKALAARRMHGEESRYWGGPLLDSGRFVTTAPAACGLSQNKVVGVNAQCRVDGTL